MKEDNLHCIYYILYACNSLLNCDIAGLFLNKKTHHTFHPELLNKTKACGIWVCEASVPWVCTPDGGQLWQTDSVTHYQLISKQVSPFPVSGRVYASVQTRE